jgi:hypothetical protein
MGKLRLTNYKGLLRPRQCLKDPPWGPGQSCSLPIHHSQLTGVDDLLNDLGHLALEQGVEHLDKEDEAGAQEYQGASQQDESHCQIREPGVHKEVVTCRGGIRLLRAHPVPVPVLPLFANPWIVILRPHLRLF